MERAAKDDTERQRVKSQLYQPPAGRRPARSTSDQPGHTTSEPPAAGKPTKRSGMTLAQAQQLTADIAAEDSKLRRR